MIGQRVSHYKILEKLGEGGMGVVYKAEDTKLERTVALKFLADHLVEDSEHKARFIREAKGAARLDHQNICPVYEIDEAGGQTFLAMAYIEGQTVKDKIAERPMRLSEALDIAIQTAQGLQAAHAKGVIHRDIKSANLMVTPHVQVKIMDFGLAQLADSSRLTQTTALLGTPAYMSPEQALRHPTDRRTDLWSLGVVLYEMVTARTPFDGEREQAVLYAIASEEHEPPTALRSGLPIDLDRIVAKALAKNPAERYQHADDLLVDLRGLQRGLNASRVSRASMAAEATARHRRTGLVIAGALALAVASVGMTLWFTRSPEPVPHPQLTRLTSDSGLTHHPSISADGTLLAYASDRSGEGNMDIWVKQIGSGESLRLTRHEADDHEPTLSPDGRTIAFRSERDGGGIYVIPTLGGPEKLIAKEGRRPRYSPDGRWIAFYTGLVSLLTANKAYVVSSEGGPVRQLLPNFDYVTIPEFTPQDNSLFVVAKPPDEFWDVWVVPLVGGRPYRLAGADLLKKGAPSRALDPSLGMGGFLPENYVLLSCATGGNTNLWRFKTSRNPWTVLEAQRLTTGTELEVQPSAAADGRIAFASLYENQDLWSLPVDANRGRAIGEAERLTADVTFDGSPALSRDGEKVWFISERSGAGAVWTKDLRTGSELAVTTSIACRLCEPAISADRTSLAYYRAVGGKGVVRIEGGDGNEGSMVEWPCEDYRSDLEWLPDRTGILYTTTPNTLALLDIATGERRVVLDHPDRLLGGPALSADGDWISFETMLAATQARIVAAPFRNGTPPGPDEWVELTTGPGLDTAPQWSPNGEWIYFISSRDGHGCLWQQRLDPATKRPIGGPEALFHAHGARRTLPIGLGMSVAVDKIVFTLAETGGNIWMAELPKAN